MELFSNPVSLLAGVLLVISIAMLVLVGHWVDHRIKMGQPSHFNLGVMLVALILTGVTMLASGSNVLALIVGVALLPCNYMVIRRLRSINN